MGDLLKRAGLRDIEDVVTAIMQIVAGCGPTVQSAVLPATTPERATDFFGGGLVRSVRLCGIFSS